MQTRSAAPVWLAFTPGLFVFLWATGFIGARLSADNAEPFSFLFVRFLVVAAILTVAAVAYRATWPGRLAAVHAMVAGALIHGGYLGCVFWSVNHGLPAGVAALIVGLQPLLTALVAAPVLGERITARHWLGLAVGILGIALVVWPKLTFGDHGTTPVTVAASMMATLSIAVGRRLTCSSLLSASSRSSPKTSRSPGRARSSSPWRGWCWCCRSAPRPCST